MDIQEAFDRGFECVKRYVDGTLGKFEARLAAAESRVPVFDVALAEPLILGAVANAIAALPRAQDGKSITTDDVAPLIRAELECAVAALPKPRDGHTPTAEDLAAPIAEAVRLAVATLPVPRDGETGPAGPMGPVGHAGAPGGDGAPGRDGTNGDNGAPGLEGPIGPEGDCGPIGPEGPAGQNGINGNDGQRGLEGPPGKLPIIRVWSDKVHYEGDAVTHLGAIYQASRDTGRAPPHNDWARIVSAGVDGRSPKVRETWTDDKRYEELDIVALNGASFIARRDDPGPCPGDGWQLFASQGKQGKPGMQGLTGPVGPRGVPGPAVTDVDLDGEGLFTLKNADGTTVERDFYPVLAKLA